MSHRAGGFRFISAGSLKIGPFQCNWNGDCNLSGKHINIWMNTNVHSHINHLITNYNLNHSQICCEVLKQLSNFSLQYYNGGRFPIPQTAIVIIVALMKLFATVLRAKGRCPLVNQGISWGTFRNSLRFLVPAILYGINNNVYFLGLTLVAPPIWLILCSFRTIITACTYKVIFIHTHIYIHKKIHDV